MTEGMQNLILKNQLIGGTNARHPHITNELSPKAPAGIDENGTISVDALYTRPIWHLSLLGVDALWESNYICKQRCLIKRSLSGIPVINLHGAHPFLPLSRPVDLIQLRSLCTRFITSPSTTTVRHSPTNNVEAKENRPASIAEWVKSEPQYHSSQPQRIAACCTARRRLP